MSSEQYFAAEPSSKSSPHTIRFELDGAVHRIATDRGTFSPRGIDPGTEILLESRARPIEGQNRILDLGCGYGPIALALAARAPQAEVWAIDINLRALSLTRENANILGLNNIRVASPEEVPNEVTFDAIWSNPPIRVGKAAMHEMLLQWLPRLKPAGIAELVVGKNLGSDSLMAWINQQGWPTKRLSSRKGYRILQTVAPTI